MNSHILSKKPLLTKEEIAHSIQKMGNFISHEYKGKNLHFIIVMKGALFFAADLLRQITIPCTFSYVKSKSYTGTKRSEVKLTFLDSLDYSDKHVIVLDDIHDSGNTLKAVVTHLKKEHPLSLKTMVLLEKKRKREEYFTVDYVLHEIDDLFLVGYGLDMHEYERNLPDIYVCDEE